MLTAQQDRISVCLFLSFGQSLQSWKKVGIFERELKLYRRLAELGIKVAIVTWNDQADLEYAKELPNIEIIPAGKHSFASSFLAPYKLRKTLAKYNIIKTEQMFGAWAALLAAKILRKPLLLRCGYELYRFKKQENKTLPVKLATWLLSFFSYQLADHITLTNPDDAIFVENHFGKNLHSKISIQTNFVDTDQFHPVESSPTRDVISIGRLAKQKNYATLIRACALAGCSLTIVGKGEDRQELQKLANALQLDVHFIEKIPNEILATAYTSHKLFALSSWFEGNPKTLLEAMSCECPIVAAQTPGIQDVISNEALGMLCPAESPEKMAKAIRWVLSNPDIAKKMGKNARNYIIENSSLTAFVEQEVKTYRNLVQE